MELIILILTALIITLVLGAIVATHRRKQGMDKQTDYKALYTLGISLIPLGIIFSATVSPVFMGILVIGVIYMSVGLKNKDKWVDKA